MQCDTVQSSVTNHSIQRQFINNLRLLLLKWIYLGLPALLWAGARGRCDAALTIKVSKVAECVERQSINYKKRYGYYKSTVFFH